MYHPKKYTSGTRSADGVRAPTPVADPAAKGQPTPYPADGVAPHSHQNEAHQDQGSSAVSANTQKQSQPTDKKSRKSKKFLASLQEALRREYINRKITEINTGTKTLDIADNLVLANPNDFASIHGSGGKGHAPRSTIRLSISDTTQKNQDTGKGVYVSVNIDYTMIFLLHDVAVEAVKGSTLGLERQLQARMHFMTAYNMALAWRQREYAPTAQEVDSLTATLQAGLELQDPKGLNNQPIWSLPTVIKTNPYSKKLIGGTEMGKVSTFDIQYLPNRDYPWVIKVTNFFAPVDETAKGSVTFNPKAMQERKEVTFVATKLAWEAALREACHYIDKWEERAVPIISAICDEMDRRRDNE